MNQCYYNLEVEHKERDHKFTCGTKGTVADTISINIKMSDRYNLQTHDDFYNELERIVKEHLDGEL